jgi:DNA modification methylase
MNSGFDLDMLELELGDLNFNMGDFGFEVEQAPEEKEVVEVEVPEVIEETKAKKGQVWQLGNHRLMCGDSTDELNIKELMEGRNGDLLFTDPPYNVNISNSQGATIENDNLSKDEFYEFLNKAFQNANNALKPDAAFYVWYASREHINFENALKENELEVHEQLIWVKNSFTFGRQDYKWQHEPCLYGWKSGQTHYFVEEYNNPTTIEDQLDFEKMKKEDMKSLLEEIYSDHVAKTIIRENKPIINDLHPTMKPVRMCAKLIRNSTRPGEIVLDLFGGSGSTLMACEQLDRKCYTMEIDPHYVDVIIKRWEQFTGEKAVLLNGN